MHEIDRLASVSVWRGTAFAALAIAATMSALAFDPGLAMRLGAMLSLLLAVLLHCKALLYHRKPVRETEVWVLMERSKRPPPQVAAGMIAQAMRDQLNEVARLVVLVAVGMFTVSLAISAVEWAGSIR